MPVSHIHVTTNHYGSSQQGFDTSCSSANDVPPSPSYALIRGPRQDVYLDLSSPSRITRVAFEVLSSNQPVPDIPDLTDYSPDISDVSLVDRSILTPSAVRFLLNRYSRCIKPRYDILEAGVLSYDGSSLKKIHGSQKFQVLVACSIAAAHESYRNPNWRVFAQVCRTWASELTTPILSVGDEDSLVATLLLLIYELADPSRGVAWDLCDLGMRMCFQLGWHRTSMYGIRSPGSSTANVESICGPSGMRLMSVLNDIKGYVVKGTRSLPNTTLTASRSLQTIFNPPTMLGGQGLSIAADDTVALKDYMRLSREIYGSGLLYDSRGCPFVGEVARLVEGLENCCFEDPIVNETWLLLLPVCVRHKQCVHCFQEPDERGGRGMRSLRTQVINAASRLIASTHHLVTTGEAFVPPLIATTRAFTAGCSVAVSTSKRWTSSQAHITDVVRCTEIMSMFASHWQGGRSYLHIWRIIVQLLDVGQS